MHYTSGEGILSDKSMQPLESDSLPHADESLAEYLRRLRVRLGLTQKEVAFKANIHAQSLGKLERGKTHSLNHKTRQGLACALQIPPDYLDAISRGRAIQATQTLKFCPQCWRAGSAPEPLWMDIRSKHCFACGTRLQDRCISCQEPITSLKHRFCPYCGTPYQTQQQIKGA